MIINEGRKYKGEIEDKTGTRERKLSEILK
jgi:hypothetical protein